MSKHINQSGLVLSVSKGFTLIELLIVIGIIGVLAAVVLVGIDPIEQMAKARDSGRKQGINQLGKAMEEYVINNGTYLTSDTFMQVLVTTGALRAPLPAISYNPGVAACPNRNNNNYCTDWAVDAGSVAIYTTLESKAEAAKCAQDPDGSVPSYLWSARDGRSGLICWSTGNAWYACDNRFGCTNYAFKD